MRQFTLSDFDYVLPPNLIAQYPIDPRDHARLMLLNRTNLTITHQRFYDCMDYLEPGDVLVVNNSKVIPARLAGTKPTGGKIEVFLLREIKPTIWECLISGKKPALQTQITFSENFSGIVLSALSDTTWQVEFNKPNVTTIGAVPLPPYITSTANMNDYQTVYAKPEGSVAAPTAGLHFTTELLDKLKAKGVHLAEITLHVGLGTFAPVKTENLSEHKMHAEFGMITSDVAKLIQQAKADHKKIIAVGTTAMRTLEAFRGKANSGWINIFITPGYTFNTVDHLITNFHLPKSTLLMLVAAFMGKDFMDEAYRVAIAEQYRFYSFGDAMMIV